MKLIRILATTALALAMTPVLAASAGTTDVQEISFDGYCDGMQLSFPSTGLGTPGTVDGVQTGCVSSAIFGQSKAGSFDNGAVFVTVPDGGLLYNIYKDHTWEIYFLSGTTVGILNSGTWSDGPPPAPGQGIASSSVQKAPPAASAAPSKKIREISFDGYCDGMQFNIPSQGLPADPRSIDGMRTGCASDGLMGQLHRIGGDGAPHGNVVSFFADGAIWLSAGIFKDRTWVLYATDGTSIYVLNSGTWSPGPPAANAAGLKSSTSK